MQKVVVDMQNLLFSNAIANTLQAADCNFAVYSGERPDKTLRLTARPALLA